MAEETDNLTFRLLQEMRTEMRDIRVDLTSMREDLTNRIDGNTVILNMLAGLLHDHENRIVKLETQA